MSIISNQQLQKCFVSTVCNHIRACCTLARITVQTCLVQLEKGIELVFFFFPSFLPYSEDVGQEKGRGRGNVGITAFIL